MSIFSVQLLILPFVTLFYLLKGLIFFFVPLSLLPRKKLTQSDVILITGGAMGLGRAMAHELVKEGAQKLVLWDINSQALESTKEELQSKGARVWTYTVDITDRQAVYSTADQVKRQAGHVTYLINNAGVVSGNLLLHLDDDSIERTFAVNAVSHFWTLKAFLPNMMKEKRGHIVTIASLAGHTGFPYLVDYCGSKFAAVGIHESLKLELLLQQATQIKLTCICPYFINTGMFEGVDTHFLQTEQVAADAVSAVMTNQEELLTPLTLRLAVTIGKLVPTSVYALLVGLVKVNLAAMSTFVGRKKQQP